MAGVGEKYLFSCHEVIIVSVALIINSSCISTSHVVVQNLYFYVRTNGCLIFVDVL